MLKRKELMVVSKITGVRSLTGAETEGWFIGCPLSPRMMLSLPLDFVYQKIIRCGQIAQELGAEIIGLGAFTSVAVGVYGQTQSNGGVAVSGWASSSTGVTYGVYGQSSSSAGYGVYGIATATTGTTYGVYGRAISAGGYGVYSDGDFAASGLKAFQIDHPLMPETHYLNHFCTEAPEPLNAYSGNVVTDAQGYATVQLPNYFEAINRDFRYQLTCIGQFAQAIVAQEIRNNQFVIRTDRPNVKVSWRVEAVRNDRWVQQYGFQTEQPKPNEHRGKYLHPDLYGQPKQAGIHNRADSPIPTVRLREATNGSP